MNEICIGPVHAAILRILHSGAWGETRPEPIGKLHVSVHIGQGNLAHSSQRELLDPAGATHVHMHLTRTDKARHAEERDLLSVIGRHLGGYSKRYSACGTGALGKGEAHHM
jgi:hypothetical protein